MKDGLNTIVTAIVVMLICALAGAFIGYGYAERNLDLVRIDTVQNTEYIERWHEPVHDTVPAGIVYIDRPVTGAPDTVYVLEIDTLDDGRIATEPFQAFADTVTDYNDTLSVMYEFPRNHFVWTLKMHPDTTELTTIRIKETVVENRPWYMDALMMVGAGAVGYVVGRNF